MLVGHRGALPGVAAAAFAAIAIVGHLLPPNLRWVVYVFKPGATFLILLCAAVWSVNSTIRYRNAILTGLTFSIAGDVFLMLPGNYFLHGLASFLLAHVAYLFGFVGDSSFFARRTPFAAYGLVAAAITAWLWADIPSALRLPVLAYVLFLGSMAAQSAARFALFRTPAAASAAWGGGLFFLSDALLAINKFGHPFRLSSFAVLSTYYAAQLLIAASVRVPAPPERIAGID